MTQTILNSTNRKETHEGDLFAYSIFSFNAFRLCFWASCDGRRYIHDDGHRCVVLEFWCRAKGRTL
ncbi:hypothetical protein THIX_30794 [Thiomonas sp. X19]|nr:hypothetical protein THIX_30794 [Thiomonas sp. X19]